MTKLLFLLVPLGFCLWVLLFVALFSIGRHATSRVPVVAMFRYGASPHGGVLIRVNDRF